LKLYRKFPLQDLVEVPIGEGSLRVRFKFPTVAQERLMSNYDIDICLYCIAEIPDIEDEEGKPLDWKLKHVKNVGEELPEEVLAILVNNRIHTTLAVWYLQNINPDLHKKK